MESWTPPLKPLEKTPLPRPPANTWAFITISGAPLMQHRNKVAMKKKKEEKQKKRKKKGKKKEIRRLHF